MKLKRLLTEDRAVSPVIGVILMVAITVILAAVIGTFVLGLGEGVQSTPQAKFAFDYQDGDLTVTHEGGDTLDPDTVNVTASTQFEYDINGGDWGGPTTSVSFADINVSDDVSAGTSITVGDAGDEANFDSSTVRIVWSDPNTDKSATLGRWSGPEA